LMPWHINAQPIIGAESAVGFARERCDAELGQHPRTPDQLSIICDVSL